MSLSEIVFKITKSKQCPFYKNDDEFRLAGNAIELRFDNEKTFITNAVIQLPSDRESCRIVISDLNRILIERENTDRILARTYTCSGCSGTIEVEPQLRLKTTAASDSPENRQPADIKADFLSKFSIFQSLDRRNLREVVSLLRQKRNTGRLARHRVKAPDP